ncbi:ABC transporter ATP-binding protein [Verrucomicrobiota bacterium]
MSDENVISVESAGKKFRLYTGGSRTLKSSTLDLLLMRRGRREDFWALKDISFSVRRGETLGIIGANGAGKSTLLSLLAGTKTPTEGRVSTRGAVSSLLELGAGFHPDLTGRENIYLAGAVMGLSKRLMDGRMEQIIDFSGIRDFIDHPVRHYSSGMYVRLGFAVAVEVDPDILLIDEVLAVGDAAFQDKCLRKMREFREREKTMLIISHDLPTIQSISDRILLLEEGRILGIGDPRFVVDQYESLSRKMKAKAMEREWGTGDVLITGVDFFDRNGQRSEVFGFGQPLTARVSYDAKIPVEDPVFGFAVSDESGRTVYGNNTQIEGHRIPRVHGKGTVSLTIEKVAMAAGTYFFSFSVHSWDHKTNFHRLDNCFPVAVESELSFEGCCYMPVHWD